MQISVNIQLSDGDNLNLTGQEAAQKVLEILGGEEGKDFCSCQISTQSLGQVGKQPKRPDNL